MKGALIGDLAGFSCSGRIGVRVVPSGSQWFPVASSGSVLDETSDLEKEC